MQFLQLKLNGFKSFVDPTQLTIAPGLTGVVGPNGCGKSNLLEALRWIMGENRPTIMRGEAMDDIIFTGTSSRSARNFAEVTLEIDNHSRRAPTIFNAEDRIEITRRVTRGIGSNYKVNGNDTRARDVQILFADASIGAHSPALVRQGQISELINARPKMRRLILEQAAGISGLHQRRHEAELKLKASENNLARVDDVLETLMAQLSSLDRQARQAVRYRKISKSLRDTQAMLFYQRWHKAVEKVEHETANLNKCMKIFAETEAKRSQAARLRTEANAAIMPLRQAQTNAQAALQRITLEQNTLENDTKRAKEKLTQTRAQIEQVERDITHETQLGEDAKRNAQTLIDEEKTLKAKLQADEVAFNQIETEATSSLRSVKDKETKAAEQAESTAQLKARYESTQRLITQCEQDLQKHTKDLENTANTRQTRQIEIQKAAEQIKEKEKDVAKARLEAEQSETALHKAETTRAKIHEQEAKSRAELSICESAEKAFMSERDALKKFIAQNVENKENLFGYIKVTPGFEAALGAAFDEDLNVPACEDNTKSGWQKLDEYNTYQTLPANIEPLSTHISFPKILSRRMQHIGLVDTKEGFALQSRLKPGQRLVSKEGDLWRWDGFISLAKERPNAAAFRLQQMNRYNALRQECLNAREKSQKNRAEYEIIKKELEEATLQENKARQHRQNASNMLNNINQDYARAHVNETLAQKHLDALERTHAQQHQDYDNTKRFLEEAKEALETLPSLKAARAKSDKLHEMRDKAHAVMLEKTRSFEALKQAVEAHKRRLCEIKSMYSSWNNRLEHAQKRIDDLKKRHQDLLTILANEKTYPTEFAQKSTALIKMLEESKASAKNAGDALLKAETAAHEADNFERTANKQARIAGEDRARAETNAENVHDMLRQISADIMQTYSIKPEALAENFGIDINALDKIDKLETQINNLKRSRDGLGAVNLRAEEDAKEIRTEYDTIAHEKEDLKAAISKLRTAIDDLNNKGRQRILKAFDAVNKNFEKLFKTLFHGGTGHLEMVENDDPLEAGLEIFCQPPGKKLSSLSLLSGGEQTLTALALIFAVFLVNPTPICVLDEVDAPLDDMNIAGFCDLLDELCEQTTTRFMIITHHPITMARMDRLYGVTMAEKGVSQLVSVDLTNAEKMVS